MKYTYWLSNITPINMQFHEKDFEAENLLCENAQLFSNSIFCVNKNFVKYNL